MLRQRHVDLFWYIPWSIPDCAARRSCCFMWTPPHALASMIARIRAAANDRCQPDQLQIQVNIATLSGSEIYETVLVWQIAPPTLGGAD
ncbi:hypothetical protein ACLK1T_13715 [Escherichia coli]